MAAQGPDPHQARAAQLRLVEALRRYGAVHAALMRAFADHLAMNPTDAAALTEILFAEDAGNPLTPARLATRIGRSRPATTALIDRLAAGGHVRRAPHPADRRAVTLHAGAGVGAATFAFFTPLSIAVDRLLAGTSDGEIAAFSARLDAVTEAIADTL